jgi:hypothetical protein
MTPDDVAKAFETQLVAALAPKATNADFDKLRQFIEKVPGPDAAQACLRRYLELFGKHENTTTRSRTLATFYLVLKRRIEIVVPLDAMYIEALPGAHPILENFKLLHRQIDAADAQENLSLKKMEKLRYVQRLLADELEDPSVTARYVFDGATDSTVSPPAPTPGGGGARP